MSVLNFQISGLATGSRYKSEIYLDPIYPTLIETIDDVYEGQLIEIEIDTPGVYTIKVFDKSNNECVTSIDVETFFPVVNYITTDVNCTNNTYQIIFDLTNPLSSGDGVQYGWGFTDSPNSVSTWTSEGQLRLPADGVVRTIFVKNSQCSSIVLHSARESCIVCNLTISNIQFTCG